MRRVIKCIICLLMFTIMFSYNGSIVEAKKLLESTSINNLFGDVLGTIQIYDNGQIVIGYKYGLRKVDVYYCEKGTNCDYNFYDRINVIDASIGEKNYKNNSERLEAFSYRLELDTTKDYGIKVEAYFGTSQGYTGRESLSGSPTISHLVILDTKDKYIEGETIENSGMNPRMRELLEKIKEIVNTIVLPILYSFSAIFLIIKGALLGTQIVKSADKPDIRAEKIHALKWLFIGVTIIFAASSAVGVLTGFFKNLL